MPALLVVGGVWDPSTEGLWHLGPNVISFYPCFANEEPETEKGVTSTEKLMSDLGFYLPHTPWNTHLVFPEMPLPPSGFSCHPSLSRIQGLTSEPHFFLFLHGRRVALGRRTRVKSAQQSGHTVTPRPLKF